MRVGSRLVSSCHGTRIRWEDLKQSMKRGSWKLPGMGEDPRGHTIQNVAPSQTRCPSFHKQALLEALCTFESLSFVPHMSLLAPSVGQMLGVRYCYDTFSRKVQCSLGDRQATGSYNVVYGWGCPGGTEDPLRVPWLLLLVLPSSPHQKVIGRGPFLWGLLTVATTLSTPAWLLWPPAHDGPLRCLLPPTQPVILTALGQSSQHITSWLKNPQGLS